jgi:hypothetical protein
MTCNQCLGIEREFDRRAAADGLRRYRRKGASASTRLLIDVILDAGVQDRTLLDIGGGVGAVQHALLRAGARHATSVDASSAYLEAARQEAERQGLDSRITPVHGDFVQLAADLPDADIVTLDRVICCYHDMRSLVARSASRARLIYGVVYPRDTWWLRPFFLVGNLFLRLKRTPFRVFLHRTDDLEATLAGVGMSRRYRRFSGLWQVAVYGPMVRPAVP